MAKEQISSILRALQILECFMDQETEWTLKALVDHLATLIKGNIAQGLQRFSVQSII